MQWSRRAIDEDRADTHYSTQGERDISGIVKYLGCPDYILQYSFGQFNDRLW